LDAFEQLVSEILWMEGYFVSFLIAEIRQKSNDSEHACNNDRQRFPRINGSLEHSLYPMSLNSIHLRPLPKTTIPVALRRGCAAAGWAGKEFTDTPAV
jgi:hypothetical protein